MPILGRRDRGRGGECISEVGIIQARVSPSQPRGGSQHVRTVAGPGNRTAQLAHTGLCCGAYQAGIPAQRGGEPTPAHGSFDVVAGSKGDRRPGVLPRRCSTSFWRQDVLRDTLVAIATSADAILGCLRERGFTLPPSQPQLSPIEELLVRYRRCLLDVRGLADTSARGYVDMVRPFVVGRAVEGQLDWTRLTAADVIAFLRSASRGRSTGSAQLLGTALRSLLGYLHIEGVTARSWTLPFRRSPARSSLDYLGHSKPPKSTASWRPVRRTRMGRAGVSLPEVSQVLRHRRLLTTAIYAKVDRESLRRLARRWPEGVR